MKNVTVDESEKLHTYNRVLGRHEINVDDVIHQEYEGQSGVGQSKRNAYVIEKGYGTLMADLNKKMRWYSMLTWVVT